MPARRSPEAGRGAEQLGVERSGANARAASIYLCFIDADSDVDIAVDIAVDIDVFSSYSRSNPHA